MIRTFDILSANIANGSYVKELNWGEMIYDSALLHDIIIKLKQSNLKFIIIYVVHRFWPMMDVVVIREILMTN